MPFIRIHNLDPGALRSPERRRQLHYQTIKDVTNNNGDMLEVLDVLAREVGILGIFSDWPATVTFYTNCKNLK